MKRIFFKQSSQSLPVVDTTEFLDTEEQEKIVQSLEVSHLRQSFIWKVILASFAAAFSSFFVISAYWQAVNPWETKYSSYFMEDLNAMTVVTADICEAVTYAFIAWGVLSKRARQYHFLWLSLSGGCGLAVFWLYHMQRLSRLQWNILWLPLGPSSFAALCLYVEHLMVETEMDIQALRASMYHFKKM